jgi:hypothetical protein
MKMMHAVQAGSGLCLQDCCKMGFEWTHQNKTMSSLLIETSQNSSFIALPKTDVGSVECVEIPANKFNQHWTFSLSPVR